MWGYSEKAAICELGKELSLETELAYALIFNFPNSITMKKNFFY